MIRGGAISSAHHRILGLTRGYPLSSFVLLTCAIYFVAAAACLLHWILTANNHALRICFQEIGGPLLAVFAMIEAAAALRVWSLFHPGEPLRTGWFFLAAAGSAHTISVITRHLLGRDILLNPLRFLPSAPSLLPLLDEFGRVLGGTLFPLLLLAGLYLVLRVYSRLRFLTRLSASDYLPLSAAAALLAFEFLQFLHWLPLRHGNITALWSIDWATEPLFILLFGAAVVLRRANLALRRGHLARCWTAYATAIFLTCAGALSQALYQGGLISQMAWSPSWLIWYPTAFALGPVFQMETMHLALRSGHSAQRG